MNRLRTWRLRLSTIITYLTLTILLIVMLSILISNYFISRDGIFQQLYAGVEKNTQVIRLIIDEFGSEIDKDLENIASIVETSSVIEDNVLDFEGIGEQLESYIRATTSIDMVVLFDTNHEFLYYKQIGIKDYSLTLEILKDKMKSGSGVADLLYVSEENYLYILKEEVIISNKSGKVLGYVVGLYQLNSDGNLLYDINNNLLAERIDIILDEEVLYSNIKDTPVSMNQSSNQYVEIIEDRFFTLEGVRSISEIAVVDGKTLYFIVQSSGDVILNTRLRFIEQMFYILLLVIILSLIVHIMIRKIFGSIFERLENYSERVVSGEIESVFEHSSIIEIDDLGHHIEEIASAMYVINEDLKKEIEKRSKAEDELKVLNSVLEEKVELRTKDLELSMEQLISTQKQLVQSEKMASLGELVAGVAHEINTPIGIGITLGSLIHEVTIETIDKLNSQNLSKSELDDYLDKVHESSKIILMNMEKAKTLINSFKNVAVDQSLDEMREINVGQYIEDTLAGLRSKYKRKKQSISFECHETIFIETYPSAIYQIITNLVVNSYTHGFKDRDDGHIYIELTKDATNKSLIIVYSDDGNGMNQEVSKRVFDPFFTTERAKGGSGLGMNIVYNLVVQKLNGEIICESEPNSGTRFTVTIPMNPEEV